MSGFDQQSYDKKQNILAHRLMSITTTMPQAKALRQLLAQPGIKLMPGVYDCISAKVCASRGFDVLYTSGLSISASTLGMPDIGLVSVEENLRQITNIANSVSIPIIADVDTGYGGATNVYRLVKQLVSSGVAGFCLEDQQWVRILFI